jgi:hypothetical protein
MAKADQLARLMVFLLLGYFALTAAEALAFTFGAVVGLFITT